MSKKLKFEKKSKLTILREAAWVLLGIILIIFLFAVFSTYSYYKDCPNDTCFLNYLKSCDRASYTKVDSSFTLNYHIEGYLGGKCVVNVDLVNISDAFRFSEFYKKSDMTCKIPFGQYYYPEKKLSLCSGLLKEGFQEALISRLKLEIVRNIGDINLDIDSLAIK